MRLLSSKTGNLLAVYSLDERRFTVRKLTEHEFTEYWLTQHKFNQRRGIDAGCREEQAFQWN